MLDSVGQTSFLLFFFVVSLRIRSDLIMVEYSSDQYELLCLGQIVVPLTELRSGWEITPKGLECPGWLYVTQRYIYIYISSGDGEGLPLGKLTPHISRGLRRLVGLEEKLMLTGAAGGWVPQAVFQGDSQGWVDCTVRGLEGPHGTSFETTILMFTYRPFIADLVSSLLENDAPLTPPLEYNPTIHSGVQPSDYLDYADLPGILAGNETVEPSASDIAEMIASIPSEVELEPMRVSPLVQTPLRPHQEAGLSFMIDRERIDSLGGRHLWSEREYPGVKIRHHQVTEFEEVVHRSKVDEVIWNSPYGPRGSILADDMALGKTLQEIALIASTLGDAGTYRSSGPGNAEPSTTHRSRATLIVCPSGLMNTWYDEISRHTKKDSMHLTEYYQSERHTRPMEELLNSDIVITTYGTVIHEQTNKKPKRRIFEIEWFRIILDEAQ